MTARVTCRGSSGLDLNGERGKGRSPCARRSRQRTRDAAGQARPAGVSPGASPDGHQAPRRLGWSLVNALSRVVRDRLLPRTSHGRSSSGQALPPLPFRMGGVHFHRDEDFVASALREVDRLADKAGLTAQSRLLD